MKVILLEDIKKLGKKFDVKELKEGYARNFLLPKGLIKIASDQALNELAKQKAVWEEKEKALIEQLKKSAEEIKKIKLEFSAKTGDKKELFGSISENEIKKALLEKGFSGVEIEIEKTIKSLGEHPVKINFGKGIEAEIKINVRSQP
ncbi:MAG: 50S ribosomal protein L9 [Candidatus Brennerbacteria bacterium]|nr:50S ribosomal protein L9 [Candidatus Brennerbacteria bacterium]